MNPLKRTALILLATLLAAQVVLQLTPPAVSAQDGDAANATQGDKVDGYFIGYGAKEEFYYWDIEKKDGADVPVIYARGGLYTEPVKFELDTDASAASGRGREIYVPATDSLPVVIQEAEKEDTSGLCSTSGIPLTNANSDVSYKKNMTLQPAPDGSAYIDLIGDGGGTGAKAGTDSYEFIWYIAHTEGDQPSALTTLAGGDRDASIFSNGVKSALRNKLKAEGKHLDERGTVKNFDYTECSYVFKGDGRFHIDLTPYDPASTENTGIAGKLLGQKGMKFIDWQRQMNNLRDYLALGTSAAYEIMQHCKAFDAFNGCVSRLSTLYQRCYIRAIGIEDTTYFTADASPMMSAQEAVRYMTDTGDRDTIWNHTIRANLTPLTTCFGGGRYTKSDKLDRAFRTEEQGVQLGQRIVAGTIFPSSIFPLDVDEVDDPMVPKQKADTTCSLGKMGWILCPTLSFLASVTDRLFVLLRQWLVVPPLLSGDHMAGFVAWKIMRDVANVLFVVFLLFVIAAQVSGGSFNAYALRTMLPRMIVIALLLNVSFYICSFGLDVSNVIGSSLYEVIRDLSPPSSNVEEFKTWEAIAGSLVLAGGGGIAVVAGTLAGLAAFVPLLITTFISMVIVLLTLLLRQSLIIILVIVAPIAIALKLLPGTDKWYEKWKTIFLQMLFLYPAIAIVFAGAYFASNIITNQATGQGDLLLAVFSLSIQVIPLFITPILMKFGGGAISSFGGMIKGSMKSPEQKVTALAKQTAEDRSILRDTQAAYSRNTFGAALRRKKMRQQFKRNYRSHELNRSQRRAIASSALLGSIAKGVGGGTDADARKAVGASLERELDKMKYENIGAQRVLIKEEMKEANHIDSDAKSAALEAMLTPGDEERNAAIIQEIVSSGNLEAVHRLIDRLSSNGQGGTVTERKALVSAIQSSSLAAQATHLQGKGTEEAIMNGSASTQSLYQAAYQRGDYQRESVVSTQSAEALASMGRHLNRAQRHQVRQTFASAEANNRYNKDITQAARDVARML